MIPLLQLLVAEYGHYLTLVAVVDTAVALAVTAALDVSLGGR